jgi:predicted CoA-substrate-specific enzyme activase
MFYAGCDLGSRTVKFVLLNDDNNIKGYRVYSYKKHPGDAALEAMETVVENARISMKDISHTVATGYGRKIISFADSIMNEIACIKKAVLWLDPQIRTVIEVGGQTIRCFNISETGRVSDSVTNEKCASGTGKFIEIMSGAMEIPVEDFGSHAVKADEPIPITNQCGVFAESETVSLLNEGASVDNIAGGICISIAKRVLSILNKIDIIEPVIMVGGVAKNNGVVYHIEEALGVSLSRYDMDPQIFPASGAALIARDNFHKDNPE